MPESPPFYCGEQYDFNDSIGHRLFGVMMLFRREADARMTRHGLTDAQWKPLWMIQSGRATTANEVGEREHVRGRVRQDGDVAPRCAARAFKHDARVLGAGSDERTLGND